MRPIFAVPKHKPGGLAPAGFAEHLPLQAEGPLGFETPVTLPTFNKSEKPLR